MIAQTEVENTTFLDWWWDGHGYQVPSRTRMEKERQVYEEAERDGMKHEFV